MKLFSFSLLLLITAFYCQAQTGGYRFSKAFPVIGEGKWDYLAINPVTNNLYVSHGAEVAVFTNTGEPVTIIPNLAGVHGIAFAPDNNKGFISNGKANTVTVFNSTTNQVSGQINTGANPDAIIYDPFSKKIYVGYGHDNSLGIIDPVSDTVIATVPLGGKPEMIVSDEAGKIFVNVEDKNEIVAISTSANEVIAHWPLGKGKSPTGLAIDSRSQRLFAGCDKMLVVIDALNGKVIANVTIGAGCDGVAFDPKLKEIYTSNGEGTLSVIHEETADKYKLLENIPTQRGARTLALDFKQMRIYLTTADFKSSQPGSKGKSAKPEMIEGTVRVLIYTRQQF